MVPILPTLRNRIQDLLSPPGTLYVAGFFLFVGGIGGLILLGSFNSFMEYSNSMSFCISCHEMKNTVYQEYTDTIHSRNTSGVTATCADYHVPKQYGAKLARKVQATLNEIPHTILGTIDTPEKFEAKRLELAENVWASMRKTDSRECRNCHSFSSMTLATQRPRAQAGHQDAAKTGETCIDCHQGIAHHLPKPTPSADSDDFTL
jgi:nitrate/TMAO reductase-like tetraheme cytochrome c subunit